MMILDQVGLPLTRGTLGNDCDGCGCPLLPREVFWRHQETWSVGCCQRCARDAAEIKLAALGLPDVEDEPFELVAPAPERSAERFENPPTKQLPLFIGSNDLPGQSYFPTLDPFRKVVRS